MQDMERVSERDGEREVQQELGTTDRAESFYDESMHDHLTERMQSFVAERIMFFLSTADAEGRTDCSPRMGPKGFVTVLDEDRIAYPEYRGNGVHASLGNLQENANASLLFIDWWETTVGLHVNGAASLRDEIPGAEDPTGGERRKIWIELEIEEAYIQCAKHIPKLSVESFDPPWGTDDEELKQSGFFTEQ